MRLLDRLELLAAAHFAQSGDSGFSASFVFFGRLVGEQASHLALGFVVPTGLSEEIAETETPRIEDVRRQFAVLLKLRVRGEQFAHHVRPQLARHIDGRPQPASLRVGAAHKSE